MPIQSVCRTSASNCNKKISHRYQQMEYTISNTSSFLMLSIPQCHHEVTARYWGCRTSKFTALASSNGIIVIDICLACLSVFVCLGCMFHISTVYNLSVALLLPADHSTKASLLPWLLMFFVQLPHSLLHIHSDTITIHGQYINAYHTGKTHGIYPLYRNYCGIRKLYMNNAVRPSLNRWVVFVHTHAVSLPQCHMSFRRKPRGMVSPMYRAGRPACN